MEIFTTLGELNEKIKHLKMSASTRVRLIVDERGLALEMAETASQNEGVDGMPTDSVHLAGLAKQSEL